MLVFRIFFTKKCRCVGPASGLGRFWSKEQMGYEKALQSGKQSTKYFLLSAILLM